ncbi:MerR family transcriptional regulator [Pseudonocardia halophobica]|uniref:MerR family transcriptional regulator n=1 Tax=Pseudonocardia halophobica TaxID=29401 RepID=UPI003D905A88
MANQLSRLDDEDYPSVSMGQAAELLGVQPAFLRSLDTAGVLHPHRTDGGHRRYSRRQLTLAGRLRELLDDGHTLASAQTIADLEDRLVVSDRAREQADDARREAESARREADDARDRAAEALDTARSDLRDRADELARARAQLDDARGEIEDLTSRLKADPGAP